MRVILLSHLQGIDNLCYNRVVGLYIDSKIKAGLASGSTHSPDPDPHNRTDRSHGLRAIIA